MATLCKNCAGTLIYDPKKQALTCKNCGASFAPEDVEDADKELFQETEKIREAKLYICNHCGSEVELNDSESSAFCLYCGNPAIVFSRVIKTRCPDKIIPFKITKQKAMDDLIPYLRTTKILDDDQRYLWLEKIRGIYLPYWIVNGTLHETVQMVTENYSGMQVEDRTYTTIRGKLEAMDLPIYGSNKLSYLQLENIAKWDLSEAVPFDEDYLAGFYSDVSDISFDKLMRYTEDRTRELFLRKLKMDVKGTGAPICYESNRFQFNRVPEYMLVPIWFLTVNNRDGKRTTFMMNGQTGECFGAFPAKIRKAITDSLKKAFRTALCSIPVIIFFTRYLYLLFNRHLSGILLVCGLCITAMLAVSARYISKALENDRLNEITSSEITDFSVKRKEA